MTVWESAALMIHLAETAKSDLLPTEPAARAAVLQWLLWQNTNLGPHAGNMFHYATTKKEGPEDYSIQRFGGEVKRLFGVLDAQLAANEYVAGEAYSLADIALYAWVNGLLTKLPAYVPPVAEFVGLDKADAFPNVRKWAAKLSERPAVVKTAKIHAEPPFKTDA